MGVDQRNHLFAPGLSPGWATSTNVSGEVGLLQPSMVSLVNAHTNATRIGWHLWEIDLRFAPGLPPGWLTHRSCILSPFLLKKVAFPPYVRWRWFHVAF
jgi:hypothetical protein